MEKINKKIDECGGVNCIFIKIKNHCFYNSKCLYTEFLAAQNLLINKTKGEFVSNHPMIYKRKDEKK